MCLNLIFNNITETATVFRNSFEERMVWTVHGEICRLGETETGDEMSGKNWRAEKKGRKKYVLLYIKCFWLACLLDTLRFSANARVTLWRRGMCEYGRICFVVRVGLVSIIFIAINSDRWWRKCSLKQIIQILFIAFAIFVTLYIKSIGNL